MRRVVLDSNGVDPIVDKPGALAAVRAAVCAGHLELLGTHVLEDELAATPDPIRRAKLQEVIHLTTAVPTAGVIFDTFKFDRGAWNDDVASLDRLRSQRTDRKHVNDALIAATAQVTGCALVTNERRLTSRARDLGIIVMTTNELLKSVGYTGP